jgi:hypothetical protein
VPLLLQVQQDEMKPRLIESFRGRMLAVPDGVVSSGWASVAAAACVRAWTCTAGEAAGSGLVVHAAITRRRASMHLSLAVGS